MGFSLKVLRKYTQKPYKKHVQIIPYIFTFTNALFGFLSILCVLNGQFLYAAYCILCAAAMDFCDGRIARALDLSSCLGAELDSLCDVVSFCLAPAVLMYSVFFDGGNSGVFFPLILCWYLCAGLFRLARFNTDDHDTMFFVGLPTPIAACFLATIVMYHDWMGQNILRICITPLGLLLLVTCIAGLMVSHIFFPSFKHKKLDSLKKKKISSAVAVMCGAIIIKKYTIPWLLFGLSMYIFGGCLTSFVRHSKRFLKKEL